MDRVQYWIFEAYSHLDWMGYFQEDSDNLEQSSLQNTRASRVLLHLHFYCKKMLTLFIQEIY